MPRYNNLLYVSHGTADETPGLKQALSLARNNQSPLKILIISPEFPEEFPQYQKKFEESLIEQAKDSILSTKKAINLPEDAVELSIEILYDHTPTLKIIEIVLKDNHDLIIKEANEMENHSGYKALDMDLLRKCPVPVWLCKPIVHSHLNMKVAVAIDPYSQEEAADALSVHMLKLARELADECSGTLHVISCWEYEFEQYLKGNSWIKASDEDIEKAVLEKKQHHRDSLDKLLAAANVVDNHNVHHIRGKATEEIPRFIKEKDIDILVMGTVARTGIPGLFIGNTAENIVQNLDCSLMALKPQGFVSPVKS